MARKKSKVVGDKGRVQAIVTDRGKVVTEDVLKQYLVDPKSKQISGGKWKAGKVIEPPYDLAKLMGWMNVNVVHSSCVRTKVQDTVGIGYYLEPDDETKVKDKEKDENYKKLMEFFSRVNDNNEDVIKVLEKAMIDYEGCGNGYIEVSRDKDNVVNGLYHVNATTIKWAKEKDRVIQKVGEKYVWFKMYGEERVLDSFTGEWAGDEGIADLDKIANEIIPLRQYTWLSACYGIPEWLPSLYNMYGDKMEQEYNIDFFVNYGVPAYALILEGDALDPEVSEEIEKFFSTTLKGSNHKMLTLCTPTGTTMKFERLSVETKEASFHVYKKDNRDAILTAHHVPPYRASIIEQGALGGNVAEETDRIYLDSVINPRQRDLEWVLNELIIKQGFEIQDWNFTFEDINVANAKERSEIFDRYIKNGVMTPNEVRKELGLEPYDGGEVYYMTSSLIPVGGGDMDNLDADDDEGLTPAQEAGEDEVDA